MSEPSVVNVEAAADVTYKPVEISTPTAPLKGYLTAQLYENDDPTNNIVRIDQKAYIRVNWWLKGPLSECICGKWCVQVHFESIGRGPEFELDAGYIDLDPCGDGHYQTDIDLTGKVHTEHCSSVYKAVVTLTYLLPCKNDKGWYKPGPMTGFCELPIIQFYESQKSE
jgi:hypothetical protein